ncbi:MAG: FprA family A-type flavoprotein [Proteobacteria bacterium]|nr:FprA family A-type flavoprotein [Pseudomonadota bacterium]
MSGLSAVKMGEATYWVGAIDWTLRNFHGYETRRGTTYNAYLLKGDTGYILVDTVKRGFERELLARVSSVCNPGEIRAIISNHAEMDHTGGLIEVLRHVSGDCVVYASEMGVRALRAQFGDAVEARAVADGSTLSIDGRSLMFLETRMLHWPDSMFCYDALDRFLFTNDAFGMHYASLERWYDACDPAILEEESRKYYANILTPYSAIVAKLCRKYRELNLDVACVAPDHGVAWRGAGILHIIERYEAWSNKTKPAHRAVVAYDTMWHSTEIMARAVSEGIRDGGVDCEVMPLGKVHRSDVAQALLTADMLVVGSPTLNQGMLPGVADVLCYLRGLKFPLRLGAAFGSYGWMAYGTKAVHGELAAMCEETMPPLDVNYVPSSRDEEACRSFGESLALRLLSKSGV